MYDPCCDWYVTYLTDDQGHITRVHMEYYWGDTNIPVVKRKEYRRDQQRRSGWTNHYLAKDWEYQERKAERNCPIGEG